MPVEDDADLAGFFNADEFAIAGTYLPVPGNSGIVLPVTVILDRPGEASGSLGESGVVISPITALIRRSQLAPYSPSAGQTLILGDTYLVAFVEPDETSDVWRLTLSEA